MERIRLISLMWNARLPWVLFWLHSPFWYWHWSSLDDWSSLPSHHSIKIPFLFCYNCFSKATSSVHLALRCTCLSDPTLGKPPLSWRRANLKRGREECGDIGLSLKSCHQAGVLTFWASAHACQFWVITFWRHCWGRSPVLEIWRLCFICGRLHCRFFFSHGDSTKGQSPCPFAYLKILFGVEVSILIGRLSSSPWRLHSLVWGMIICIFQI